MKIIHRVSISATSEIQEEFSSVGIAVQEGFSTFEVEESHASWPLIEGWIAKYQAVDIVQTKFSKKEIANADWLELVPSWHYGYPQPDENNFGYLYETFDLSEYCTDCGIGAKQKAPFRMKSEPKWGKNSILQLNWVFDEFFMRPEVWEAVFEKYGIPCRPVLDNNDKELQTVVQLAPLTEIDIATESLVMEACGSCGRTKYLPPTRGPFPPIISESVAHMIKTRQLFGSGSSAHRCVLVSRKIAAALVAHNVRGVTVRPVTSGTSQA